jgi:hypothetical protein
MNLYDATLADPKLITKPAALPSSSESDGIKANAAARAIVNASVVKV